MRIFANDPTVRGTQAKMVLGSPDFNQNVTRPQIAEAVARVGCMAFVGLTACFSESARLFKHRFRGFVGSGGGSCGDRSAALSRVPLVRMRSTVGSGKKADRGAHRWAPQLTVEGQALSRSG